jgi:hypothetical protein
VQRIIKARVGTSGITIRDIFDMYGVVANNSEEKKDVVSS